MAKRTALTRFWPPTVWGRREIVVAALALCGLIAIFVWVGARGDATAQDARVARAPGTFEPTASQWATLTVEPVQSRVFRAQHITEGKITVNEERSTPIFSPYSGRVRELIAKPGDQVEAGQSLFVLEATDAVQVHNDFMVALSALAKARSQLKLTQIVETRQRELYEGKAVALKDLQQAQADLAGSQSDLKSAEAALDAARNRMRILGRSDAEIAKFEETRSISPLTAIVTPISGTVVQRKVGPGQYISNSSSDPVYVIGDLSTVWLIAYVRETEAPKVAIGQALQFSVLAYPDRIFAANINYVATALDQATRRLMVRATINNAEGLLKPEMFARVTILTGEGDSSLAVPRDAVIYEGDTARVWITRDQKTAELRLIKTGLTNGRMIQVLEGLQADDKVITRGSLFIDRAATGS